MRVKTWKVLDYGRVPVDAGTVSFTCPCGAEAEMPCLGRPLAQIGAGIVFDNDVDGYLPETVQCRRCRRILTGWSTHVR